MTVLPGAGLLGDDVMVPAAGGRHLRAMVGGTGDTLVVLEAGMGANPLSWVAVQRLLRDSFRVVAYDRAGIGGSDPAPGVRTLDALAADLVCVVDAVPHRRVVLAGHSWGGPIVRVAAARRRAAGTDDVAGLVLVDQSDEHDGQFFTPWVRAQFAVTAAVMPGLARVGVDGTGRAFAAEMRPAIGELRRLRDHPLHLGDLPIRVISGQQMRWHEKRRCTDLLAGHRRTAQVYPGAVLVPAFESGHGVPRTEPALVAAQIRAVADQAG